VALPFAVAFAEGAPLTDMIFGDEIVAPSQSPNGVSIQLRSRSASRFDLVVGADGLHSQTGPLAFGPDEQFEKPLGYAVVACETQDYQPWHRISYGRPLVSG